MAWLRGDWYSGCRADVGEDDFFAGVEALDLPDLCPGLAGGAEGMIVVRAEFPVAGRGVADEHPGGLADDAGNRDDGFLLAALAGDPPVHRAEAGTGPGRGHRGLPEGAAQVPVALAGAAGLRGFPGLLAAGRQPRPSGGVPGRWELGGASAELGDDGPAVDGADAGDLLQPGGQVQDGYVLIGAAGSVAAAGQPARDTGRRCAGNKR